jgi:ribosomal protein S18 acetylase RimI-like enzyme
LGGTGHKKGVAIDTPIHTRRFRESDLSEIIRIVQENLAWNLSESERADGFLSVDFGPDQVLRFNRSIPIVVSESGPSLTGFLMGSSLDESASIPILVKMIECYDSLRFDGRFLNEYRSYVYGPVCVDRSVRGQGVLESLFRECLAQLAGRFEIGVLFVSAENERSIEAHRRKLGMELVGEFEFDEKMFQVLAFRLPGSPTKSALKA